MLLAESQARLGEWPRGGMKFVRIGVDGITARNAYILNDDMVLGQVDQGIDDTLLLFAPGDDHLALNVLEPPASHDGQVLLAGGLCELDIVRVEIEHLQTTKPW